MRHVIVIPYISVEEESRFLKIGQYLKRHNDNAASFEFLFVTKNIDPSKEVLEVFSGIAPVKCYRPKAVFNSYPEGPDEFFWKTMDYINAGYEKDGGFVLWFESDMIPKSQGWLDLIELEWKQFSDVLIMGLYFPAKYIAKVNGFVLAHINGGAAYSKDLAKAVPVELRGKYFDISLFQSIKSTKKYHKSELFKFSHRYSLLDDIYNNKAIMLHGYRQDKNQFIAKAIDLIESQVEREREKEFLTGLPRKNKICCDLACFRGNHVSCSIHEKNTFLVRCKNSIIWCLAKLPLCLRDLYKKYRCASKQS